LITNGEGEFDKKFLDTGNNFKTKWCTPKLFNGLKGESKPKTTKN
jgi:hypothetical protein